MAAPSRRVSFRSHGEDDATITFSPCISPGQSLAELQHGQTFDMLNLESGKPPTHRSSRLSASRVRTSNNNKGSSISRPEDLSLAEHIGRLRPVQTSVSNKGKVSFVKQQEAAPVSHESAAIAD
eukprot:scaffold257899_cov20-Prasinocladus_malaysianus.AAC.1